MSSSVSRMTRKPVRTRSLVVGEQRPGSPSPLMRSPPPALGQREPGPDPEAAAAPRARPPAAPPCTATRSRIPISPSPPPGRRPGAPRPSSVDLDLQLLRPGSGSGRRPCVAPACLTVFVIASCTIRYAACATRVGQRHRLAVHAEVAGQARPRGPRSTRSLDPVQAGTGGPASGCGRSPSAVGRRAARRASAAARRPRSGRVCSTAASASRATSGSLSITRRAAAAWTPITDTWWATTSCSSRAIRTRSAMTACARSRPATGAAARPGR